jgi:WXG100 family type VII secretion target
MSEIMLKASDARGYATEISRAAEDAAATIQSLTTRLNSLSDSFRGAAQQKFEQTYHEWANGQQKAKDALVDLSTWLGKAADQIEEVDRSLASGLG